MYTVFLTGTVVMIAFGISDLRLANEGDSPGVPRLLPPSPAPKSPLEPLLRLAPDNLA